MGVVGLLTPESHRAKRQYSTSGVPRTGTGTRTTSPAWCRRRAPPGLSGTRTLFFALLLLLLLPPPLRSTVEGVSRGVQGPVFTEEPPQVLQFTNSTGAIVNCVARGSPTPSITWTTQDGRPLQQLLGIRNVLVNGSLVFRPFADTQFDQSIHSATYHCRATNSAGTINARPTHVRAVIVGQYEVQVYDQLVMKGNTAVLRCSIPSFIKEYVSVTSWLQDGNFNIYPSLHGDGKYHMTPWGDLHVLNVGPQDGHVRYQCRTLHKLTGHAQLSEDPARIIITEAQASVAPRISERLVRQVARQGERVLLPCVAQGHPPPSYTWLRGGEPVEPDSSLWMVGGSLVLGAVSVGDAGDYTCVVNNSAGTERYTAHLVVPTPLSIQVSPSEAVVDSGGRLELRCHVSGQPVDRVTWYKDGTHLRSHGRVRIRPREVLHISGVERSDTGMYQCVASSAHYLAHGQAQVTLGAAAPTLSYQFIEQTLKPGPAVSLKCIARGTPTPHITWTLDGFPLPSLDRFMIGQYVSAHGDVISHVNISSVQVSDGGRYRCSAANSAGRVQHTARLNVYGPPHVRPMGTVSAVAGKTFNVTCPASGYPLHSIIWMKDSERLPTNHRQRVHPNGTLVVEQVQRVNDEGLYSCSASNKQGQNHSQSLHVKVMVPPRLVPFSFPTATMEGMRAQASCLVQQGDQPLSISWLLDGRPLSSSSSSDSGLRITNLDAYSSVLTIERASAAQSGNYTCVARNAAREVAHTATLSVSVPPSWVVEPADVNVALDGSVALHCLAKGFPAPMVVWRRETVSGQFVGSLGRGVTTWSNGTMVVSRAQRMHEGRFLCEASNGVGAGLSKVATITVNEPPWFSVRSHRELVVVDRTAVLNCEAHGDPPLTITWTKNDAHLSLSSRFEITEHEESQSKSSQVTLRNAQVTDTATYVCTATNPHGSLTSDFHLVVQDVPTAPTGLTMTEEGPRHLTLTWTTPEDSNAPITAYIVSYHKNRGETDLHDAMEVTVEGSQNRVRIEALHPATEYVFTVEAENSVGRSSPSRTLSATTHEEQPAGYPRNIIVDSTNPTALDVKWEPLLPNETHGHILGYYLGFKDLEEKGSSSYNFTTVGVDGDALTETVVAGLRPYTRYAIVLQAFNSRGAGPTSPPVVQTTKEDTPSAPPNYVRCESLTSYSLQVTWSTPPARKTNGAIIHYRLTYIHTGPRGIESGSLVEERQRVVIPGLHPWTNYSITVAAATRAGIGVASAPVVCTTQEDLPNAPVRVKAVVASPSSVVVAWAPPNRPNGHIVLYTIYWDEVGSRASSSNSAVEGVFTHLTLNDLQRRTYQVWVTASTAVGEGPVSEIVTVRPDRTVGAGVWSVGGNVTAAWKDDVTLLCGTVGQPEPTITWTHRGRVIGKESPRVNLQPDGSALLVDVQRSDKGTYTCTATNIHANDSVSYSLTVLVPPATPTLHVTETTSSSIRVQWTNTDTGGAPLTGATLHYRAAGGEWRDLGLEADRTWYTLTGLRCGTQHHFFITAHNSIGTSEASTTVSARTKGQPPEAPEQFQFVTTNSSQATLYLAQWGTGGCDITHFSVKYRRENTNDWITVGTEVAPSRTLAVGGLEEGQTYVFSVTAHNAAGTTPAQYKLKTPARTRTADVRVGFGLGGGGLGAEGWENTPMWQDARVLVPAAVSVLALTLTGLTVCICINRRPGRQQSQKGQPDDAGNSATMENKANQAARGNHVYTTIRKAAPLPSNHQSSRHNQQPHPLPPQPPSSQMSREGDYSEDDLYPYATATFQVQRDSPPPPAPPSPPSHGQPQQQQQQAQQQQPHHRNQKGFTALVYQPPSLHDVDSPNVIKGYHQDGRKGSSGSSGGGFVGGSGGGGGGGGGGGCDTSETEDYSSMTDGERRPPHPDEHQRRPRHHHHHHHRARSSVVPPSPRRHQQQQQQQQQHTLRHIKPSRWV